MTAEINNKISRVDVESILYCCLEDVAVVVVEEKIGRRHISRTEFFLPVLEFEKNETVGGDGRHVGYK